VDLGDLNAAAPGQARGWLLDCCASTAWANTMTALRPFADADDLQAAAERVWRGLDRSAWLEAFAAHPRIGERVESRGRFSTWSRHEQEQAASADEAVLADLAACNRAYEERFGHVLLVFATGRTAAEVLDLCRQRLGNEPEAEVQVAAAEQAKITDLRLRRLLGIV